MYNVQSETTTENFSIQTIPSGGATVSVNGTSLSPTPFVSLSKDQYKIGELVVGGVLRVSLNGTVVGQSFSEVSTGIKTVLDSVGEVGDCINVNINCSGASLVNGYGVVSGVSIEEGPDPTWVNISKYSIEIELYENNGQLVVRPNINASDYVSSGEVIKDVSENVSLNVDNDAFHTDNANSIKTGKAHAKYSFTVNATGAAVGCNSVLSAKTGIEAAEEVCARRIGNIANGTISTSLGTPNRTVSALSSYHNGDKYMHIRSLDADPVNGSLSVSGDIILRPSGHPYPQAFIDISVDSRTDATQIGRIVTVSGNVEGLYSHDFSNLISNGQFHSMGGDRLSNAETVYSSISSSFLGLANSYVEDIINDTTDCTDGGLLGICQDIISPEECNLREVNKNITRNFGQGTISFSHEYSTAKNCSIPGAAKVETEVTRNYPTDVFAEFTIPFRGEAFIQDLQTKTKETLSISVNITVEDTGCNARDLENQLGCARSQASSILSSQGASSWYKTGDSVTKTNTGSLRLSLEYTKPTNC